MSTTHADHRGAPLSRHGHATDLGLERLAAGELTPADFDGHFETCPDCQRRLDALAAADLVRRPPAPRASRAFPVWIPAGLAVAAGLFLLFNRPGPPVEPDDGLRLKGGFTLEVHVHDGQRDREALDNEAVRPGDRVAFRVRAPQAGHLLIGGVDATGAVYTGTVGATSLPFGPTDAAQTVGQALRLDATPGTEHLTALLCPTPFALADVESTLRGGEPPPDCLVRRLRLVKAAP